MVSGNIPAYDVNPPDCWRARLLTPLLAVPFFILAGNLMNCGGITTRIYNFALALVGWPRAGCGHVNIDRLGDLRRHERHGHRRRGGLGTIEIKAMRDTATTPISVGVTGPRNAGPDHPAVRCRS
jgi:hypothetical protein